MNIMSSFKNELIKIAGSDITFYPGRFSESSKNQKKLSPSTGYHYETHGKYSVPSLFFKENIKGLEEEEGMTYVKPEIAKSYIEAYKRTYDPMVKEYAASPTKDLKEYAKQKTFASERKRFLGIPYGRKITWGTKDSDLKDPKVLERITKSRDSDINLKKTISGEHTQVLNYLKKHQDKGFSVVVR